MADVEHAKIPIATPIVIEYRVVHDAPWDINNDSHLGVG